MRKVSAPTYFKYKELSPNDVLITRGTYLETKEGTYGDQHYFEELEGGERKCLNSSGQLNYLVDTNLIEGDVCSVVYKGKITLEKGAMKGKEAHQFDLFLDDDMNKNNTAPAPAQQELPVDLNELE